MPAWWRVRLPGRCVTRSLFDMYRSLFDRDCRTRRACRWLAAAAATAPRCMVLPVLITGLLVTPVAAQPGRGVVARLPDVRDPIRRGIGGRRLAGRENQEQRQKGAIEAMDQSVRDLHDGGIIGPPSP